MSEPITMTFVKQKESKAWFLGSGLVKMDSTVEQLGMTPPRPRPVKYPAKQNDGKLAANPQALP